MGKSGIGATNRGAYNTLAVNIDTGNISINLYVYAFLHSPHKVLGVHLENMLARIAELRSKQNELAKASGGKKDDGGHGAAATVPADEDDAADTDDTFHSVDTSSTEYDTEEELEDEEDGDPDDAKFTIPPNMRKLLMSGSGGFYRAGRNLRTHSVPTDEDISDMQQKAIVRHRAKRLKNAVKPTGVLRENDRTKHNRPFAVSANQVFNSHARHTMKQVAQAVRPSQRKITRSQRERLEDFVREKGGGNLGGLPHSDNSEQNVELRGVIDGIYGTTKSGFELSPGYLKGQLVGQYAAKMGPTKEHLASLAMKTFRQPQDVKAMIKRMIDSMRAKLRHDRLAPGSVPEMDAPPPELADTGGEGQEYYGSGLQEPSQREMLRLTTLDGVLNNIAANTAPAGFSIDPANGRIRLPYKTRQQHAMDYLPREYPRLNRWRPSHLLAVNPHFFGTGAGLDPKLNTPRRTLREAIDDLADLHQKRAVKMGSGLGGGWGDWAWDGLQRLHQGGAGGLPGFAWWAASTAGATATDASLGFLEKALTYLAGTWGGQLFLFLMAVKAINMTLSTLKLGQDVAAPLWNNVLKPVGSTLGDIIAAPVRYLLGKGHPTPPPQGDEAVEGELLPPEVSTTIGDTIEKAGLNPNFASAINSVVANVRDGTAPPQSYSLGVEGAKIPAWMLLHEIIPRLARTYPSFMAALHVAWEGAPEALRGLDQLQSSEPLPLEQMRAEIKEIVKQGNRAPPLAYETATGIDYLDRANPKVAAGRWSGKVAKGAEDDDVDRQSYYPQPDYDPAKVHPQVRERFIPGQPRYHRYFELIRETPELARHWGYDTTGTIFRVDNPRQTLHIPLLQRLVDEGQPLSPIQRDFIKDLAKYAPVEQFRSLIPWNYAPDDPHADKWERALAGSDSHFPDRDLQYNELRQMRGEDYWEDDDDEEEEDEDDDEPTIRPSLKSPQHLWNLYLAQAKGSGLKRKRNTPTCRIERAHRYHMTVPLNKWFRGDKMQDDHHPTIRYSTAHVWDHGNQQRMPVKRKGPWVKVVDKSKRARRGGALKQAITVDTAHKNVKVLTVCLRNAPFDVGGYGDRISVPNERLSSDIYVTIANNSGSAAPADGHQPRQPRGQQGKELRQIFQ